MRERGSARKRYIERESERESKPVYVCVGWGTLRPWCSHTAIPDRAKGLAVCA